MGQHLVRGAGGWGPRAGPGRMYVGLVVNSSWDHPLGFVGRALCWPASHGSAQAILPKSLKEFVIRVTTQFIVQNETSSSSFFFSLSFVFFQVWPMEVPRLGV